VADRQANSHRIVFAEQGLHITQGKAPPPLFGRFRSIVAQFPGPRPATDARPGYQGLGPRLILRFHLGALAAILAALRVASSAKRAVLFLH